MGSTNAGTWKLKIVADGETVKVFKDGAQIGTTHTDTLATGFEGWHLASNDETFYNVRVSEIEQGVLTRIVACELDIKRGITKGTFLEIVEGA